MTMGQDGLRAVTTQDQAMPRQHRLPRLSIRLVRGTHLLGVRGLVPLPHVALDAFGLCEQGKALYSGRRYREVVSVASEFVRLLARSQGRTKNRLRWREDDALWVVSFARDVQGVGIAEVPNPGTKHNERH